MDATKDLVQATKDCINNPLLLVEPADRGAGHFYEARDAHTGKIYGCYESVTEVLNVIGGSKSFALRAWAVKVTADEMQKVIVEHLQGGNLLTPEAFEIIKQEAKRKHRQIAAMTADLGTRVHMAIDGYINGTPAEEMDEDVKIAYNNFMSFVFKHNFKFVCGDMKVANPKKKYGGRLDALAIEEDELVLLDWKTTNAIRDDVTAQIAGYNQALRATTGLFATRGITVRFDKVDPKIFETKEVNMKGAEKTWNSALALHQSFRKEKIWKVTNEKN